MQRRTYFTRNAALGSFEARPRAGIVHLMAIESISAVTLATHDIERACAFYHALGFRQVYRSGPFATFHAGNAHLNLVRAADDTSWSWWGRLIFYVDDVDAQHQRALDAGYEPSTKPADAPWGERYFHINDPDGHELSFARPLRR
jgi:catechol 2,3-dioxygenase-like lactoylglutathione lyase family enzyme